MLKLEYVGFANEVLRVQGPRRLFSRVINVILPNSGITSAIKKSPNDYGVFLDIGAAFGHVTSEVSSRFSKCVCFEPSRENYKQLLKTIEREELDNVITYNCALGSKNETKRFFCSEDNPYDNRFSTDKGEKFTPYEVEVVRLDDVCEDLGIEQRCVIKIDVQGYELEVMQGARKLLEKDCRIISEFWPWGMYLHGINPLEYVDFMMSMGYSFFELSGKRASEKYVLRLCKLGKSKRHVWDDFLIKQPT